MILVKNLRKTRQLKDFARKSLYTNNGFTSAVESWYLAKFDLVDSHYDIKTVYRYLNTTTPQR